VLSEVYKVEASWNGTIHLDFKNSNNPKSSEVFIDKDPVAAQKNLYMGNIDAILAGYMPGDTETVGHILSSAESVSVRDAADAKQLELTADAPSGHYEITVDPQSQYVITHAKVSKSGAATLWGTPLAGGGGNPMTLELSMLSK
jgi:hypothetical protein